MMDGIKVKEISLSVCLKLSEYELDKLYQMTEFEYEEPVICACLLGRSWNY